MSETIKLLEAPKSIEQTKPATKTPHSEELEEEIIRRLIWDVVVPPAVKMQYPKNEKKEF